MIVDERISTYIDSVSWELTEELKEAEREAAAEGVPIIRRPMQSLLRFLMRIRKPQEILEIGTAVGFSGMLMLEYAGAQARLDTIERYPAYRKTAKKNFEKYGKKDQICFYEGEAQEILPRFAAEEKSYDFIFMDAAKGQYLNFLPPVLALLREGGMLVTDNVLQDGQIVQSRYAVARRDRTIHARMRKYLYTLTHSAELDTVILPVGDGAAISVRREKERAKDDVKKREA